MSLRQQRAELATRQDEDGLRQEFGLCREAAQELRGMVFARDDGRGPERVTAAELFAIAAALHGSAVGIGAAFERWEIVAPAGEQFVECGIGRERGGVFILVDEAVCLAAEERQLLLFFVFAYEVVAELIGEERGALVEFERRRGDVRAFRHEAELVEQVLCLGVDAADLDGHLGDVAREMGKCFALGRQLLLQRLFLLFVKCEVLLVVLERGCDVIECALPRIALRRGIGL